MDARVRARFKEELPRVYKHVLARAIVLVRRHLAFARTYDSIGKAAEELAHEAIARVLSGDRIWDPGSVPDLVFFMKEAMRSILCADLKGEMVAMRSLDLFRAEQRATGPVTSDQPRVSDDASLKDPEREIIDAERCSRLVDRALEAAGTDPNLAKIVDAIADGCSKSGDIQEATGLSIEQVYAGTRKLRRRLARGAK